MEIGIGTDRGEMKEGGLSQVWRACARTRLMQAQAR